MSAARGADLKARMTAGAGHLLRAVAVATAPVMIDLHDVAAGTGQGALRLQCWLGVVRVLAQICPVLLVLPQSVRLRIAGLLPPGARAIAAGEVEAWSRPLAALPAARRERDAGPRRCIPACCGIRPRCACRRCGPNCTPRTRPRPGWSFCRSAARHGVFSGAAVATLDAADGEAVARLVLRLLIAPGETEIVCAAAPPEALQAVLDVCALRGLAFHGAVDAAAFAPASLPRSAGGELARRAEAAALAFTLTSNSQETPCLAA